MIKALRQPGIKRLWFGQAFSSVGDEIYRVGLTWFAVGLTTSVRFVIISCGVIWICTAIGGFFMKPDHADIL
jgi:hypothetical protein